MRNILAVLFGACLLTVALVPAVHAAPTAAVPGLDNAPEPTLQHALSLLPAQAQSSVAPEMLAPLQDSGAGPGHADSQSWIVKILEIIIIILS